LIPDTRGQFLSTTLPYDPLATLTGLIFVATL